MQPCMITKWQHQILPHLERDQCDKFHGILETSKQGTNIWISFSSRPSSRWSTTQELTLGKQLLLLSSHKHLLSSDTLPVQGNTSFKSQEKEVLIPAMAAWVLPHQKQAVRAVTINHLTNYTLMHLRETKVSASWFSSSCRGVVCCPCSRDRKYQEF